MNYPVNDALADQSHPAQPQPEARWYAVSRDGRATLCVSEQDARECAASQDVDWPNRAPHRAVQLIPAQPQPEAVPPTAPLPEPDFTLDGDTLACYYAETVTRLLAAQAAQARGTK